MKRAPLLLCCCITVTSSQYYQNINPYYYNQFSKDGVPQDTGRFIRLPHAGISSLFGNIRGAPVISKTPSTNTFISRLSSLRHNLSLLYLASTMINPTAINPVMPAHQPMAARLQSVRVRKNISVEPKLSPVTKKATIPLPVIRFQSSQWVWPKGDITGPLLGLPVRPQRVLDKVL